MNNNIRIFGLAVLAAAGLSACSDQFLEDKKNYDNVNTGIYDYYEGANARVSDVYSWCLPTTVSGDTWNYPSNGSADNQAKSTEEYSGFSAWVNPDDELHVMNGSIVPDYFHNQANNIQNAAWGRIRNINDVIRGINGGSLSQEQKDELLGQVYFFRAWCYYQMVKWYGGVPIVKEVLEPLPENSTLRSSAKECIEFMIEDLDRAATMLAASTTEGGWRSGSDWGRVTAGTALALKGRVLLLWCSPLFNRANDEQRWKDAYTTMKADLQTIQSCGYGLYQTAGNINGSDFAAMFSQSGKNPEAVFVTLYNTIQSGDTQKNNIWERSIRPKNATGGGLAPSAMLVDLFPMADGKLPSTATTYTKLDRSSEPYEADYPFMNRDPRFYRTFAFPGVRWAYSGDATMQEPNNPSYNGGKDYELWNYCWYTNVADRDNEQQSGYFADNLLQSGKGMYVRKKSDDLDVNASPLYANWAASATLSGFAYSAAPHIELRYAEVLLNLAEVAAGAGDLAYAADLLKQIRQRAGYTGDCGLANITADQPTCLSAVLYERMIELAYEGKRFDDMRRWMLFDGGANFGETEGAPASWTVTGWGGNTCQWLGYKQFNGQRRENLEFRVNDWDDYEGGIGGTTKASDPILLNDEEDRGIAIDLRKELAPQAEALKGWYADHLVRKMKKGDSYDSNQVPKHMHYFAKYYFLGLPQGALNSDQHLEQTIGWEDSNNGGANGTFDPLK